MHWVLGKSVLSAYLCTLAALKPEPAVSANGKTV